MRRPLDAAIRRRYANRSDRLPATKEINVNRGRGTPPWGKLSVPNNVREYRVFVSSPSGLEQERAMVRTALDQLSQGYAGRGVQSRVLAVGE